MCVALCKVCNAIDCGTDCRPAFVHHLLYTRPGCRCTAGCSFAAAVRLRSHISQYREILQLNEPVGRKLDFLTQELNRETNTIGSKCQDLDITRIVVDMKAEIEKIREQIQNLE